MQVFKFGGGCLINAQRVKQLLNIVSQSKTEMVIVVSAFGKTTNALEKLLEAYFYNNDYHDQLHNIKKVHFELMNELFITKDEAWILIKNLFNELENKLKQEVSANYDFEYDQIVPYGELISTLIVSEYLNNSGIQNEWLDARLILRTDNNYREATIDWGKSKFLFNQAIDFSKLKVFITQGFIGGTGDNYSTTLGREGSDFSAAIIANIMNAINVTIWKDVPGILSADPKIFSDATLIPEIDYQEAIELTYYGAKVIHEKTIKPLMEKNIPLYVKAFLNPKSKGTTIKNYTKSIKYCPTVIVKENQALCNIRFHNHNKSSEQQLYQIFQNLSKVKIKSNLVHISTAQLSFCINNDKERIKKLFSKLKGEYDIEIKENIELITIRHHDDAIINKIIGLKKVILTQKDEENIHFIISN